MELLLTLVILTVFVVALEIASLRFGVDSREPGDWHAVERDRRSI